MSLILDALKRAERERQADATPAPDAVAPPGAAGGTPPRRWRLWLALGIAGAIGAAVAAALLLGKPAPQPAPEPEAQAQPPVIVARPAPPVQEPAPAVVPGTEAVTSLDDLTDEATLEAEPPPLPVPAQMPVPPEAIATRPAPPPATSPPQEIHASPAPAPAVPPGQTTPPAQTAPPPQEAPPAEIPPALTQPAPLKKFREMPPAYRADFPSLKIEIHVYEKSPPKRFAMINGRKYREGERMAEGPVLVEIVPDGIVFEYRGEKVLYTLGR